MCRLTLFPDRCLRAVALAAVLHGPATLLAQDAAEAPRSFTAAFDRLSLDLRNNESIYTNVAVTDGSITINALEGTTDETSFENSRWRFAGSVRVAVESAVLTAASATFIFSEGKLLSGELLGAPVEITDFIDEQQTTVRGTAERIVFDNEGQTAALYGEATLTLGSNEYSGCDLIYHLADRTFNSGSSDCRTMFTIYPEEEPESSAAESAASQ